MQSYLVPALNDKIWDFSKLWMVNFHTEIPLQLYTAALNACNKHITESFPSLKQQLRKQYLETRDVNYKWGEGERKLSKKLKILILLLCHKS